MGVMGESVWVKSVFKIGQSALDQGVPEALLGCPFILMADGCPDAANRHLQDLWRGRWHPDEGETVTFKRRYRVAPSTVEQVAYRLLNFLQWCGTPRMHLGQIIDPLRVGEEDIDQYARHMESGAWSSDGLHLAKTTIAQRQVSVIHLRKWAEHRGLAPALALKTTFSKVKQGAASGNTTTVTRKHYAVVRRADPSTIMFPTSEEVKEMIQAVEDPALQLGAKLVFFCGLRASEVVTIKVADVISDIRRAGQQRFISVLGKGRKRRNVEIDSGLYDEIEDYVEFERKIRAHRSKSADLGTLLLSERGCPFAYRTFWANFKAGGAISPHLGRHWYAVHYLLKAWASEQRQAARDGLMLASQSMEHHLTQELITLQLNLGHAHISTTQRYLVALHQLTAHSDRAISFQDWIDGDSVNGLLDA
ncbi:MAG: hypothetical protein BGO92_10450 [Magnetospirillum sp. 64-120]|nr:MAG: hypothetical protein BGO92_10450 [Magnetospirillum sp. 64-120]